MALDQATRDRISGDSDTMQRNSDAWSRVPEGTQLPSGRVFSRNVTNGFTINTTTEQALADDRWVQQNYGNQSGGGTVNRQAATRIPSEQQSQQPPAPPAKTVSRDDPRRPKAEEVQDLDAALQVGAISDPTQALWNSGGLRTLMLEQEERRKAELEAEKRRNAAKTASKYIPQYYSGTQAQIYFDDVLIDEIVQIQYSTATNKMPIYGYASELFDTVASGNLLVQGNFVINFVEAGYLAIIAAAMLEKKFGVNAIGRRSQRKWVSEERRSAPNSILQVSTSPTSILTPGSYLSNQAINQVRGLGNKEFRALAREANINKLSQSNQFSGIPQGYNTRFDLMAPFDIYAVFGDYTDPEADHTVRKLKNVYLTGQAQTIISSGEPVGEVYNFICRTIE
jgi:hypothetical protein